VGGVEDIGGDAAVGDAAVVGAVGVVDVDVFGEVSAEAGVADVQVAGEAGSPAFVEDRLVESFDVAVGLGTAWTDAGVAGVTALEELVEAGPKLVAIVRDDAFELPPSFARSWATRRASLLVWVCVGWRVGQVTRSAQA
jgi:hypothetical protein